MSAIHRSIMVSAQVNPLIIFQIGQRRIRIDSDEINLAQPDGAAASARCLGEGASALRKGSYKGSPSSVAASSGPVAASRLFSVDLRYLP
jgi:hypothetical protein